MNTPGIRESRLPLASCLALLLVGHGEAAATGFSYFRRGDANGNGSVDLSDAISTLGYLFRGTGTLFCADAADANDDGTVDISDALYSLGFLFNAGARIPEPYPACGSDSTPDSLSCLEHAGCAEFSRCPDPAAQTIRFEIVRRESDLLGTVLIRGTMKNRGGMFESAAGLQEVKLYEQNLGGTPRLVATTAFADIGPSGEEYVSFRREWNASELFGEGRFPPSYLLAVVYAHGIGEDDNPRNDDCDFANNLLEVSGDGINDLFADR